MLELKIYLLGSPRVELGGAVVEMDTRKALAILAFLVVTGTEQRRDTLAALLWPDYDHSHAMGALRRTLSALRTALGDDHISTSRESISLEKPYWSDYVEFNRLLAEIKNHDHPVDQVCPDCLQPLTKAADLYRDNFLAGFSLRDSSEFDNWQFFHSELLRQKLSELLEKLSSVYTYEGDFRAAIRSCQRWLATDPLHEPAHRQLMRLYAWSGQRSSALRQYQECVKILEKELGVKPLEETTELYSAIKDNQLPRLETRLPLIIEKQKVVGYSKPVPDQNLIQAESTLKPDLGRTDQLPLVGRESELKELQAIYQAIHQKGHFLILEGEPGIGKSRLAEEFMLALTAADVPVLQARCYQGEGNLAYGPFITILRGALEIINRSGRPESMYDQWLNEAARLLPELYIQKPDLTGVTSLESPGAQTRFYESLSQILLGACEGHPAGVIFFDDLHWADEASLDLLIYLIRRSHDRPIFIFATWRQEDVTANHRLRQLLMETHREGRGTLLHLNPLSTESVKKLLRAALPSNEEDSSIISERLHKETDGLPFFVIEYLKTIISGEVQDAKQNWKMPGSVHDLLFARITTTSETGLQLLQTAAVIGRSFDFDILREASGRSDEETVSALEGLMQRGLVREVTGGPAEDTDEKTYSPIYDFSHEKIRELIYEETSGARRKILHRRVGEALVSHAHKWREVEIQAGVIARHLQLANQNSEAAVYYQMAGEHARSLFANSEALSQFRKALALGYPRPAVIYESIGDLLILSGDYSGACSNFMQSISENISDPQSVARLERKLATVLDRNGEWEQAEHHFEQALASLKEVEASGEAALVYADWSLMAHHKGETGQAQELANKALQIAQSAGDKPALAQANNIIGILARNQEDYELALASFEQSLVLAETLEDPGAKAAALNNMALVHRSQGNFERAQTLTEAALQLCILQGDRHREAALHNNLADLLHAQGKYDLAMENLKTAVRIFAEIDTSAATKQGGGVPEGYQPEIWKLSEW